MRRERRNAVKSSLKEASDFFGRYGWEPTEVPTTALYMHQSFGSEVDHRLMFYEPLLPGDLPTPVMLGFSCKVMISFVRVESLIARLLGLDLEARGSVSVSLSLARMAPGEHTYLQNVHLVRPEATSGNFSLMQVFDDYLRDLEPIRQRLTQEAILGDQSFVPPGGGIFWQVRRAAYAYLTARPMECERQIRELQAMIDTLSAANESAFQVSGRSSGTQIADLKRRGELRAADEAKRFAEALSGELSRCGHMSRPD